MNHSNMKKDTYEDYFFREIVEQASDWIWEVSIEGKITYTNPSIQNVLGYYPHEIIENSIFDYMPLLEKTTICRMFPSVELHDITHTTFDVTMLHKDGQEVFTESKVSPKLGEAGLCIGYRVISRDITLYKRNQLRHKQLLDILDATPDFIATADMRGNVLYLNPAAQNLLGVENQSSETCWDTVSITDIMNKEGFNIANKTGIWRGETTLTNVDQQKIPVSQIIVGHENPDGQIHFLSTISRDITERKAFEQIIQHQAHFDSLTELPNRRLLHKKISDLLENNPPKTKFAVFFIDIDNFKEINDTFGHQYGDRALQLIANRLKSTVRSNDFICRLGGDEFIILLDNIGPKDQIQHFADRLVDIFQHPFQMGDCFITLTCSIGISIFPENGVDVDSLLAHADQFMYAMKKDGKNGYRIMNQRNN